MKRIAVRTQQGRLRLLEPGEIYYLEAREGASVVRTARRQLLPSPRSLEDWEERLAGEGFFRIHRSYLVNLDRVREIRLREGDTNDWEAKLDPPVNRVLPISRNAYRRLIRLLEV